MKIRVTTGGPRGRSLAPGDCRPLEAGDDVPTAADFQRAGSGTQDGASLEVFDPGMGDDVPTVPGREAHAGGTRPAFQGFRFGTLGGR